MVVQRSPKPLAWVRFPLSLPNKNHGFIPWFLFGVENEILIHA